MITTLIFCAWISICSCFKKLQDRFLGSCRQFDKLLIISTSLGRRCSAVTSWSIANQDCHGTSARSQGAPVQVAAGRRCSVAQTWSDWIRRSACACAAARQIAVVGTARRRLTARRRRRTRSSRDGTVTVVNVHEKYSKKYCWKYIQKYCQIYCKNYIQKYCQIYCWKYVHILIDVYACIFDENTSIYWHILIKIHPSQWQYLPV